MYGILSYSVTGIVSSPRSRAACRKSLISARRVACILGCFAISHNTQVKVLAVVSTGVDCELSPECKVEEKSTMASEHNAADRYSIRAVGLALYNEYYLIPPRISASDIFVLAFSE